MGNFNKIEKENQDQQPKQHENQESQDKIYNCCNDNNNNLSNKLQPVEDNFVDHFFSESVILVTGATGFLGKALLERLLRSFTRIRRIYVLIRPKRGRSVKQRFEELLSNPVFERLRWECPCAMTKLKPVSGDVSMPELGLGPEDLAELRDQVNIVFHAAATVRFDEPLKYAVNLNTRGTERVLELCRGISGLKSIVHVSTAYSNADLRDIQELVYTPRVRPQTVMDMCEHLDDETLVLVEPQLMGRHPNTYTLTKSMAEHVVLQRAEEMGVGIAIVRPSIVCAAAREPFPGWVDNVCGITGVLMEIGRGTIRSIVCRPDLRLDAVPVDYVVSTLLCSAWHVAKSKSLRVYNCTSGSFNPIKWGEFGDLTHKHAIESPSKYIMFYPKCTYRTNKFIHKIASSVFHFLPAYLFDTLLRIRGAKPQMVKMTQRSDRAAKTGEFFAVNEWHFHVENMKELIKCTKGRHNIDISSLDWDHYVQQYMLGIRKYILKDNPDTITKARSKLQKLYWLHKFTQLFTFFVLLRILTRAVDR